MSNGEIALIAMGDQVQSFGQGWAHDEDQTWGDFEVHCEPKCQQPEKTAVVAGHQQRTSVESLSCKSPLENLLLDTVVLLTKHWAYPSMKDGSYPSGCRKYIGKLNCKLLILILAI